MSETSLSESLTEVSTGLRDDVFGTIVRVVVPGTLALAPFLFVLQHYVPALGDAWTHHQVESDAIAIVCIIGTGLVLEDLGSELETIIDAYYEYRSKATYIKTWRQYLRTRRDATLNAERYLDTIVVRLKFELSMVPALVVLIAGLLWLQVVAQPWSECAFSRTLTAVSALLVYLTYESFASAATLDRLRNRVLETYSQSPTASSDSAPP